MLPSQYVLKVKKNISRQGGCTVSLKQTNKNKNLTWTDQREALHVLPMLSLLPKENQRSLQCLSHILQGLGQDVTAAYEVDRGTLLSDFKDSLHSFKPHWAGIQLLYFKGAAEKMQYFSDFYFFLIRLPNFGDMERVGQAVESKYVFKYNKSESALETKI